jgi:hypothetical protein
VGKLTGEETVHLDEWWGLPVSVDFNFLPSAEITTHLATAGFALEELLERDPIPEVEYESRRGYIFARRLA